MVLIQLLVYIIGGYFASYWIEDYTHCSCWHDRVAKMSEAERRRYLRLERARVYVATWYYFLVLYLWIVGAL